VRLPYRMSDEMKLKEHRDWAATITLAVLMVLTAVLAMMDPSCQRHAGPHSGVHSTR
jgi:hypothetical protein